MSRFLIALPIVAVALCACGGGSSVPRASSNTAGMASVSVAMRVPAAATTTASTTRRPAYVSAGTASVQLAVTVGSNAPVMQTFPVTPGTGSCPTVNNVTTCTFALQVPTSAPSANATLTVTTYDAATPTPNVLASGTVPFTLDASGTNTVGITLGGVIGTLAVSIAPTSVAASTSSSVAVNVVARDPDGYAIIGSYATSTGATASVALTSSDTNAPVTPSSISSSSTTVSVAYNGSSTAGNAATITATAGSASAKAALVYLASGGTTVYFVLNNGTAVAVAPGTSNGPALRTLTLSATPSGTSGIAVTPNGTVYVQVGPSKIDVFAPGATNTGPKYTIVDTNFSASFPIRAIAPIKSGSDTNGVVLGGGNGSSSYLDVFSPTNTGSAGTFTPDVSQAIGFGPIITVVQSPKVNAYFYGIGTEGNGYPEVTILDGSVTNSNPYVQYSSQNLSSNFTSFPVFWDQGNATTVLMAADETDSLMLITTDTDEVTPFGLNFNGQESYDVQGHTGTQGCQCMAYAPEGSNVNGPPFKMSGSFPTQMTFDASGNLFALQGTSYNEFTRATIVSTLSANSNDSGQTMSSSSSTTYSNASVLGATVGP